MSWKDGLTHGTPGTCRPPPSQQFRAGVRGRQPTHTAQVGRDGRPHPDASSPQALADGQLDVEDRDSLEDQGDEVGDEEGPCKDTGSSEGRRLPGGALGWDGRACMSGTWSAAVSSHLAASHLVRPWGQVSCHDEPCCSYRDTPHPNYGAYCYMGLVWLLAEC